MNRQRLLRRTLDVFILALIAWLLLAALYVSLGRQFVPIVADYQAELVARAEQATGRAIELKDLTGEMQGAQPVFTLRGLTVHAEADPASPVLFALDHVVARLDVFASLWQRQPVMDALQLQGLTLEVIESADGNWALQGLGRRDAPPMKLQEVADRLFSQRRITLLDSQILIRPQHMPDWSFNEGDLTLINGPDWHRLDGRLTLPSGDQMRWRVDAASRGPGSTLDDMSLGFYLDLPEGQWSEWLPSSWLERLRVQRFVAGGQFWGAWGSGRLQQLKGELWAPLLQVEGSRGPALVKNIAGRFAIDLDAARQSLDLERFSFSFDGQAWPNTRLQATRSEGGEWDLRMNRLPLALTAKLAAPMLADDRAKMVAALDPAGHVRGMHLQGNEDSLRNWRFEAELDDVGIQAWQGMPSFSGISGYASGSPAQGQVRLAAAYWSLHLPRLFESAWPFDSLRGALNWEWSPERGLELEAPGLAADGETGQATVKLSLALPPERERASMQLNVALQNTRAEHYARYLPVRSPAFNPRLTEWLASTEIGGEVPLALFEYSGSLLAGATADQRRISLIARLQDGRMIPQPGWPELEEVSGTLRLVNQSVVVEDGSAQLWGSRIDDIRAQVGRAEPGQPLQLSLAANIAGPVGDGLRFLREAPISPQAGKLIEGWDGEGEVTAELQFALDLVKGAQPDLELGWSTDSARLAIPMLQAPLTDIAGQFSYVQGRGVQADDVSLQLLGQPITLAIASEQMNHSMRMSGRHSLSALAQWPLLEALPEEVGEGAFDWQGTLELSPGEQNLELTSDLVGLRLDLPAPFGKPAEQPLPSRLALTLADRDQRWAIQAGDDTFALIERQDGMLAGELSHRLGRPEQIAGPGLGISARLDYLDLKVWQTWLGQFEATASTTADATAEPAGTENAQPLLRRVQLGIADFEGFGLELEELLVKGSQSSEGGWEIDVAQADVEGRILLPASASQPMTIALERLRLPRAESVLDDGSVLVEPLAPRDVLAELRPSQLRPFDLGVNHLYWGNDEVGSLAFVLRPSADGAHLNDLALALRGGLRLNGNMFWGETVTRSRFTGEIEAEDIGAVLRAWDYAPTLTSEHFAADVDLDWPGSPAYFAFKRSTGLLALRARDGMLKSGEGSADALRVFGLLNFNALTRRLRLDFSDLFGRGTAYDTLIADLSLTNGVMKTREPLIMEGPSAKVQLDGQIDLPENEIDMGMLVTLPVTNNLPLAAILAGAPHIGGVLFLADKILGDKVARFASVKYRISGDWQQPTVEFDRAFDDKPALQEESR